MEKAGIRCTWKMRSRSMRKRGEWECDVLQQFYCFSLSVWCDREWLGSTFLPFLAHSCHIGWFAGIYQRIHLNFLFITEICSRGICRSFTMDVFILCLHKSEDEPTNFHISLLILYWDVYYIFLAWGKSHLSWEHSSFFCFLWKAVLLSRLCLKDTCSKRQAQQKPCSLLDPICFKQLCSRGFS